MISMLKASSSDKLPYRSIGLVMYLSLYLNFFFHSNFVQDSKSFILVVKTVEKVLICNFRFRALITQRIK